MCQALIAHQLLGPVDDPVVNIRIGNIGVGDFQKRHRSAAALGIGDTQLKQRIACHPLIDGLAVEFRALVEFAHRADTLF